MADNLAVTFTGSLAPLTAPSLTRVLTVTLVMPVDVQEADYSATEIMGEHMDVVITGCEQMVDGGSSPMPNHYLDAGLRTNLTIPVASYNGTLAAAVSALVAELQASYIAGVTLSDSY